MHTHSWYQKRRSTLLGLLANSFFIPTFSSSMRSPCSAACVGSVESKQGSVMKHRQKTVSPSPTSPPGPFSTGLRAPPRSRSGKKIKPYSPDVFECPCRVVPVAKSMTKTVQANKSIDRFLGKNSKYQQSPRTPTDTSSVSRGSASEETPASKHEKKCQVHPTTHLYNV